MADFLVEDFSEWVIEAQKYYKDLKPKYEFVVNQDIWSLNESICYLIGISPEGVIENRIIERQLCDSNGELDLNMLEINCAYDNYRGLIIRAVTAKRLNQVEAQNGLKMLHVNQLIDWALEKNIYINRELLGCKGKNNRNYIFPDINLKSNIPLMENEQEKEDVPINPSRRDQQLQIMLVVITALDFDALQIPDGGKSKIKKVCLTQPRIFTHDSFDHAWKAGLKKNIFKLKNSDKYTK